MSLNLPRLPENITGIDSLATYANEVTDQWFGSLILLLIFYFFMMTFNFNEKKVSFMVSSIITVLASTIFYIVGIISLSILIISFIITIIAIGIAIAKKED